MDPKIILQPAAERDLVKLADYLAEASLSAATRFTQRTQQALKLLLAMPEIGPLMELDNPDLAGLRFWKIKGFKRYLIFYRPTGQGIEVFRVLHSSRDIERILENL